MKVKCPVCSSDNADLEEYYSLVECKACGMKVSYSEYLNKRSTREISSNRP